MAPLFPVRPSSLHGACGEIRAYPTGTEAVLEPLQATVWSGTSVLSSKSPCLGPTVTRKPVDGESSSSASWEIHSWDQGY